ncbi:YhcH/YjgK/YiaL family protein [Treponema socranskii]|uniref:YhcH/YjgK/YiaL family protein n=1 Tax=Treponema socranskii TaxID=53419 RepID=UPI003D6DF25C
MKSDIRFLVLDVDGTLTDGKIYMGSTGETFKVFDIKDGCGIAVLLPKINIEPIIITARESQIVKNRCGELGIKYLVQGEKNKLEALNKIISEYNTKYSTSYSLLNCAYMGDDIIDLPCMNAIKESNGLVACPADAVTEVKSVCNYICTKKAGTGAVREFIEWLGISNSEYEIHDRINKALLYLQNLAIETLHEGKYEVDSDFYYSVQGCNMKKNSECQFESHKKYVNIQLMVEGSEIMEVADITRLSLKTEYDDEKDIMFWDEPTTCSRVTLQSKDYIILYPEHAYRVCVVGGAQSRVYKIIGKVKI